MGVQPGATVRLTFYLTVEANQNLANAG